MIQKFYVYKITNLVNGYIYIGKSKNWKRRFDIHCRHALSGNINREKKCPKLYNNIRKYGKENFSIECLLELENEDDAYNREKELVDQYDSFNNGMNSAIGGKGNFSGDKNSKTLVSLEKKYEIFNEYCKGIYSTYKLADMYTLPQSIISNAINDVIFCDSSLLEKFELSKKKIKSNWAKTMSGEGNPSNKLTDLERTEICNKYLTGKFSTRKLAQLYNVGKSTIIRTIKKEYK